MAAPENIHPTFGQLLGRESKETLLKQRGTVVWLYGLSGSGKSTLANALERRLHDEDGFFLSLPLFRERRWLRTVLVNPHADTLSLDRLLAALDRLGAEERAACSIEAMRNGEECEACQ